MNDIRNQKLEKNFISAVVYLNTAESEESLGEFLTNLSGTLRSNFVKYEIICVDDDSPEKFLDIVRETQAANDLPISILHMSFFQGIELSMNAGRDLAIGDYVIEFDECTWNFPDEMIMQAYREVLKEYDVVCCADHRKSSKTSKAFYLLFNQFSGTQNFLESDNFRILSRRGINRICSLNKTIPYRKAVYANCGLKFKILHFDSIKRNTYSRDKKTKRFRKSLAVDSLLLYTNIGTRFSVLMAFIMAGIAVILAAYSMAMYLKGVAVVGWTTTMLFLSVSFFGFFVLMAIAIKYLSLLVDINFKEGKYLFKSIEKL